MVDIADFVTMDRFLGVNNVDDPVRIYTTWVNHKIIFSLLQANNVDIDNTYRIKSRPGWTGVATGSDIHSLWSDNLVAFFVDGQTLYKLYPDWSQKSLVADLQTGARVSYAPWNDRVYYTNGYQIGYLKGDASYNVMAPTEEFKLPLPAGQLIEQYKARLYVARDKVLYISDPLCDYYDVRDGYKIFNDRITLLRAVDRGIFVGDAKVWWVKGDTPEEMERDEAYSFRPIIHTDARVEGQHISEGIHGKVAMWTGENGICLGDNSGKVANLTEARYKLTEAGQGACLIRDVDNVRHYITTLF